MKGTLTVILLICFGFIFGQAERNLFEDVVLHTDRDVYIAGKSG